MENVLSYADKRGFLLSKGWVELLDGTFKESLKGSRVWFVDDAFNYETCKNDGLKSSIEFVEDERKVIGWKFKEGFEKYERTCCEIINTVNNDTTHYSFTGYGGVDINKGILFKTGSSCEEDLREAGVLDIWFEPVFEEIKIKSHGICGDEVKDSVNKDKICRSMLELEFAYKYKGSIYESINEMTFNDKRIHFLLGKIAELQLKMEANGK